MVLATYLDCKRNKNGMITSLIIREDKTSLTMEVPADQIIRAIKSNKI